MQKKSPLFLAISVVTLIYVAALMIACGGGSASLKNLTPAQAQAIAKTLSNGVAQALTGTFGVPAQSTAQNVVQRETTPQTTGFTCTPTATGETCTFPVSATFNCSGGGTMAVSGTIGGTLDNSGNGSVQGQIAADPANCSVGDGIVINGDPSVNVTSTIAIQNDNPVFPLIGTENGAVTYGPNPAGTCQLNVTYSINSNLSCTATGTACGHPVSGSC